MPRFFLYLILISSLPLLHATEYAWGTWLSNAATAKRIALENNRPIIIVIGSENCSICDKFDNYIITSQEIRNFAIKNKLVLVEKKGYISTVVYQDWIAKITENNYKPPFILIAKVKEDANLINNDSSAFSSSEIELLVSKKLQRIAAFNYPPNNETINGVSIPSEMAWSGESFLSVISSFFPNQYWDSNLISNIENPDPVPNPEPEPPLDPTPDPDPGIDQPDNDNEWGVWLNNAATAKRLAFENNRPIIIAVGSENCSRCDKFDDNIITSTEFKNFARQNKLVLFKKSGYISTVI